MRQELYAHLPALDNSFNAANVIDLGDRFNHQTNDISNGNFPFSTPPKILTQHHKLYLQPA